MTTKPHTTHADLNQLLKRAFPILEGDLEANRTGKLSAMQREHMRANQQSGCIILGGCGMIVLFIMITAILSFSTGKLQGGFAAIFLIIGFIAIIYFWLKQGQVFNALPTEIVESIQGPIKYEMMRYKGRDYEFGVRVAGKLFSTYSLVGKAFIEGESYILYYLKDSNHPITAEHIASESYPDIIIPPSEPTPVLPVIKEPAAPIVEESPLTASEKLHRAFATIDADLKANRDGYFSISQQMRLQKKQLEAFFIVMIYLLIVAFFGVLFAGAWIVDPSGSVEGSVAFALILVLGLILLVISWPFLKITREMWSHRVVTLEGPVTRRSIPLTHGYAYWIEFNTRSFNVSVEMYEAFAEPGIYILYFTPLTETWMAAEHIPDDEYLQSLSSLDNQMKSIDVND